MRSYGGLLEPRGSNLTPLKSTFNAEHFICRPGVSISPGLESVPCRDRETAGQTDRQTDRIPLTNKRSEQYLPVQLSRVKTF